MKRVCFCLIFSFFCVNSGLIGQQQAPFPAFPPADVTRAMDAAQMRWQLGIEFPAVPGRAESYHAFLLPKYRSMGLEMTLGPQNSERPEANWTWLTGQSSIPGLPGGGTTIIQSPAGLWNNYIQAWEPGGSYFVGTEFYKPLELHNLEGLTAADWPARRAQLFAELEQELYGAIPEGAKNLKITWTVSRDTIGVAGGIAFRQYDLLGTIDVSSYPAVRNAPVIAGTVRVPTENVSAGAKIPLIIGFGGRVDQSLWEAMAPLGFGVMGFNLNLLQPDNGAALTSYLIGLVNKGNWRKPNDWGALVAWSWGVSRLIDYFESHNAGIDPARIGLTGHSRYGKATLVAMAWEPRLAIAFPSSSGSLGVAPARRHWGQDLEDSAGESEYHWMAGNFMKYVGVHPSSTDGYLPRKVLDLKVDAESLVALCAPRPILIGSGSEVPGDAWADPYGQFLTAAAASPVYELLGKKGVQMADFIEYNGQRVPFPRVDKDYLVGDIGYRRHNGGHSAMQNYPAFALFAARYLR